LKIVEHAARIYSELEVMTKIYDLVQYVRDIDNLKVEIKKGGDAGDWATQTLDLIQVKCLDDSGSSPENTLGWYWKPPQWKNFTQNYPEHYNTYNLKNMMEEPFEVSPYIGWLIFDSKYLCYKDHPCQILYETPANLNATQLRDEANKGLVFKDSNNNEFGRFVPPDPSKDRTVNITVHNKNRVEIDGHTIERLSKTLIEAQKACFKNTIEEQQASKKKSIKAEIQDIKNRNLAEFIEKVELYEPTR